MKILDFLNKRFEEIFLVILMAAAVVIVAAQVVTRYVLKVSLPWSEEIARYIFLWLTWVGASYATKERKHVSIDLVYEKMPQAGKKVCTLVSTVIWMIFLFIMARLSLKLTRSVATGGQIAIGSGIPMWVPYASIPVGMILMLFRLLQNCYHDLKAAREEEALKQSGRAADRKEGGA